MRTSFRTPTLLVMLSLALIGGASASLGSAAFAPVGAVVGALWGWALGAIAKKISAREDRRRKWANAVLFVTAFLALLVAGSSFMAQLLSTAAMHVQPGFFAQMLRGSIGTAESLPFYLLNTPLEWLLVPSAFLLTWNSPRQRWLLIAVLAIWTINRSWTYIFFVPQVADWVKGTAPFTASQVDHARTWIQLSWVRQIFDDLTGLMVLSAIFARPEGAGRGK